MSLSFLFALAAFVASSLLAAAVSRMAVVRVIGVIVARAPTRAGKTGKE